MAPRRRTPQSAQVPPAPTAVLPAPSAVLPDDVEFVASLAASPDGAAGRRRGRNPLAPLKHRDYAWFWSGAFISNGGTWLQNVALQWTVFAATHSPFWVSMVTFAQFFPVLLFGLPGGLAADRFERRRVLLVTQTILMLSAFDLAAASFAHAATLPVIFPLIGVGGIALAFNAPSFQAMIADMVPDELLLDAIALNTAQLSAARVIGPVLGAVALATVGASWAFFGNGVSFLAVIAALLIIRPARHVPAPVTAGRALFGGFHAVAESPQIKTIILVTSVVSLFGAPVIALLAVIAGTVLHLGSTGFGLLFAVFSVGAVVGALLAGSVVRMAGMERAIVWNVAVMAGSLLAIAASRNVAVTSVALAATGFAYTTTTSATSTGIQMSVRADQRGRVMSLYMMAWAGLFPIGSVLVGLLASRAGVPAALIVCATPLAIAAAALRLRPETLRRIPAPA